MGDICCVPNRCIPGEKYTNKGNKGDSSQEKEEYIEGVGASHKRNGELKGDIRASVQAHVRSDPEVLEVFLEGRENLVH